MKELTIYGRNASGGRNVSVECDGLRVLVESSGEEHDKDAQRLARAIAEHHEANVVAEGERSQHRAAVAELTAMLGRANERAERARSALESAINGRRRFFGPVLCVPGNGGWEGEVWLVDAEKRERGLGLRFASLAELREAHPELWIVKPESEGIILDVCPIPEAHRG